MAKKVDDGTRSFKVSLCNSGGELDSRQVLTGPGMTTSVKATVIEMVEKCAYLDHGDTIVVTEIEPA